MTMPPFEFRFRVSSSAPWFRVEGLRFRVSHRLRRRFCAVGLVVPRFTTWGLTSSRLRAADSEGPIAMPAPMYVRHVFSQSGHAEVAGVIFCAAAVAMDHYHMLDFVNLVVSQSRASRGPHRNSKILYSLLLGRPKLFS